MYSLRNIVYTLFAISGFVPDHLNFRQVVVMGGSVLFSLFVLPIYTSTSAAIGYFLMTTLFYLGLISFVLPRHGLRLNWIRTYGEEKAYELFEGLLALAFFHNALGLSHVCQQTAHTGFWGDIAPVGLYTVVGLMLIVGMGVKIWSALVVGVPIYYWKDMFLGRPIGAFVVSGPYQWLSNPMYGIGQLQVYALALYYNSLYGLICAVINQALMFSFYYAVERPFIQCVYVKTAEEETRTPANFCS